MTADNHTLALRILHRELGWQEDLKALEDKATTQSLTAWWGEADAMARTVFMADFLELYLSDQTFSTAIDNLVERSR